jgi:hypothetical protein
MDSTTFIVVLAVLGIVSLLIFTPLFIKWLERARERYYLQKDWVAINKVWGTRILLLSIPVVLFLLLYLFSNLIQLPDILSWLFVSLCFLLPLLYIGLIFFVFMWSTEVHGYSKRFFIPKFIYSNDSWGWSNRIKLDRMAKEILKIYRAGKIECRIDKDYRITGSLSFIFPEHPFRLTLSAPNTIFNREIAFTFIPLDRARVKEPKLLMKIIDKRFAVV